MKTTSALCANEIKRVLKVAFPKTKFSVKSDNFAGGDAVRIKWNLGPSTKSVRELTQVYEYGHFDGMTDMYEISNRQQGINQTKYITESRTIYSDEDLATLKLGYQQYNERIKQGLTLQQQIEKDLSKVLSSPNLDRWVYRLLNETDLLDGYHGIKLENDKIVIY